MEPGDEVPATGPLSPERGGGGSIRSGTRLGRYQIVARIGGGGMGEVFRARDEQIGREVAVKVISGAGAMTAELRRRFELEARAAGALSHANVLTVFDVGDQDGTPYLVTELLEGETLRALLRRGRLPEPRAIELMRQLCRGLAAAHAKGIVHRDLKPENLFLLADGRLKILDFGLAKLIGREAPAGADQTAAVVGTAGYLAPEVLRGDAADARADLFAAGAILYEMLVGERAFKGASAVEAHHAALHDEPPLDAIAPPLQRIVNRCLEKAPADRFQSAADLDFALAGLASAPATPSPRRRRRPLVAAAALLLAGAAAVGLWRVTRTPSTAAAPTVRAAILPPPGTTFATSGDVAGTVAVSPDGQTVALLAIDGEGVRRLWLRRIDGTDARALPGTEGVTFPFWSPDGRALGFFSYEREQLLRVDVAGGAPTVIARAHDGRGGSWNLAGQIVFAPDSEAGLSVVSAAGGEARPVTTVDRRLHTSHRWPVFLPDGRRFLFLGAQVDAARKATEGIYVASLDGGSPRLVVASGSQAALSAGHILFVRGDGALVAQPFDEDRAELHGSARVLAEGIRVYPGSSEAVLSAGGAVVAYQVGGFRPTETRLVWCDRQGNELAELASHGYTFGPELSPDGRRVAADLGDPSDLWIYDVERAVGTRLTSTPATSEWDPVWSPDGTSLAYVRGVADPTAVPNFEVVVRALAGGGVTVIPTTTADNRVNDWSPDGRWLIVTGRGARSDLDVWRIPARGDGGGEPLLASPFTEANARLSRDGRWLAYVSDEAGRPDVYVTQFPRPAGKWRISTAGGDFPRWRADGRELYFVTPRWKLMAARIAPAGDGLEVAAAQPVAAGLTLRRDDISPYDVAADGERLAVVLADEDELAAPVTVLAGALTP